MKQFDPMLEPRNLAARLEAITNAINEELAYRTVPESSTAFEAGSNEFGLVYGTSCLLHHIHRLTALVQNNRGQVHGQDILTVTTNLIGDALLLTDYIARNPHLITDGRQEEVILPVTPATPSASESNIPVIPPTDETLMGEYDAR